MGGRCWAPERRRCSTRAVHGACRTSHRDAPFVKHLQRRSFQNPLPAHGDCRADESITHQGMRITESPEPLRPMRARHGRRIQPSGLERPLSFGLLRWTGATGAWESENTGMPGWRLEPKCRGKRSCAAGVISTAPSAVAASWRCILRERCRQNAAEKNSAETVTLGWPRRNLSM